MTKLSGFVISLLFFGLILVGAYNFIGFNANLAQVTVTDSSALNRTLVLIEEGQNFAGDINETTADEGTIFVFRGMLTSVKRFVDIGNIFSGFFADISVLVGIPEEYVTIIAGIVGFLIIMAIIAALLRWNV